MGQVFIPTNGVTIDYYGGHHPGDNLYGTSLISLDARTGERVWHFQMVHHDIWNFDTPTAPILLDTDAGPIVAQATKQGYVYVFNRETGEPIWPIEEVAMPASTVPGEHYRQHNQYRLSRQPSSTQDLARTSCRFYSRTKRQALQAVAEFQMGPLFNPPMRANDPSGKQAALMCPSGAVNITHRPSRILNLV